MDALTKRYHNTTTYITPNAPYITVIYRNPLLMQFIFFLYIPLYPVFSYPAITIPSFFLLQGNKEGSFLWMVKRDPPSYFFGTIHVPYTRVWEHIPNNTKRAFRLSDNVFFELDLTDPYTVSALTTCQLLPRVSPSTLCVSLFNCLSICLFLSLSFYLSFFFFFPL